MAPTTTTQRFILSFLIGLLAACFIKESLKPWFPCPSTPFTKSQWCPCVEVDLSAFETTIAVNSAIDLRFPLDMQAASWRSKLAENLEVMIEMKDVLEIDLAELVGKARVPRQASRV